MRKKLRQDFEPEPLKADAEDSGLAFIGAEPFAQFDPDDPVFWPADIRINTGYDPNDPLFDEQWHLFDGHRH